MRDGGERNALSVDLFAEKVFLQKLNYIHNNPVQQKWQLAGFRRNINTAVRNFMKPALMTLIFLRIFVNDKLKKPSLSSLLVPIFFPELSVLQDQLTKDIS